MRHIFAASLLALGLGAAAQGASAQTDRYGGVGAYAAASQPYQPAPAAYPTAPRRVLSWPGKTIPAAPQRQAEYGPQPQFQPQSVPAAQATYGYAPAQGPQQAYRPAQPRPAPGPQASYPSPYQPQPYYAPAPGAPAPPPGSTATAPTGVYPTNTVPPQLAHPMAVPPQQAAPLVTNPQLPSSIYAPPQAQAQPRHEPTGAGQGANTAQSQMVAANGGQGARYYSLHRQFGLHPDPTPAPLPAGAPVDLVSSIDSGVGGEPAPAQTRTRVITSDGKTTRTLVRPSTDDAQN